MRLLNTSTLIVEEFIAREVPEYVILSHTWDEEEVTLVDMISGHASKKKGYSKIEGCCEKALSDGFTYCWIDTCCIDKTSSAELSEAINSMYKWYAASCTCYVYLPDVKESFGALFPNETTTYRNFDSARWFKRGWTLQELIAPAVVEFYDGDWKMIGTRHSLREQIARNTGIDRSVLEGKPPGSCNVAVRMSWASRRKTTRVEDEAYCLLGLFGVNMPLLYGEGRRAFRRLQEEILRVEEDYTMFVWNPPVLHNWSTSYPSSGQYRSSPGGMFAVSTSDFGSFSAKTIWSSTLPDHWSPGHLSKNPFTYIPETRNHLPPYLTSRGLRLSLPLTRGEVETEYWACVTMISLDARDWNMLCILLRLDDGTDGEYHKALGVPPLVVPRASLANFHRKVVYVTQPVVQDKITRFDATAQTGAGDDAAWVPDLVMIKETTPKKVQLEVSSPQIMDIGAAVTTGSESTNHQHRSSRRPFADELEFAVKHKHGLTYYGHNPTRRLGPVIDQLRGLDQSSLERLTLHNDRAACYIVDGSEYTWFAFRIAETPLAFVARTLTALATPHCEAWSISSQRFDAINDDPRHITTFGEGRVCRSDHVILSLASEKTELTARVTISIRRIATSVLNFPRYVLSVAADVEGLDEVSSDAESL